MSDDKRCVCHARMVGECVCGAWDAAADDERAALLRRVEELEAEHTEARNDARDACEARRRMAAERDALREQLVGLRKRMTEVLRADPRRSIGDDRSMSELCDFVCGDVLLFREHISRLQAAIENNEKQWNKEAERHERDHQSAYDALESLRSQLAQVKAARDEACDEWSEWEENGHGPAHVMRLARIERLRKIGD